MVMDNVVTLSIEDGGYLYVSSEVYRDALLLNDRVGSAKSLAGVLGATGKNANAMINFELYAPSEVGILGAYLTLLNYELPLESTMEDYYGLLHMMSMLISFNNFSLVKYDVRKDTTFDKAVLEGYKESWQQILTSLEVKPVQADNRLDVLADKLDTIIELLSAIKEEGLKANSISIPNPVQNVEGASETNSTTALNNDVLQTYMASMGLMIQTITSANLQGLGVPVTQPVISSQNTVAQTSQPVQASSNSVSENNEFAGMFEDTEDLGDVSDLSDFFDELFAEAEADKASEEADLAKEREEKQRAIDEAIATGDLSKINFDSRDDMKTALASMYA